MFKTVDDVSLVDGYNVGDRQFYLRMNGVSDCVCEWWPLRGQEYRDGRLKLVWYEKGSIKVHLSQSEKPVVLSLLEAKRAVADHYNRTYLKA